MSPPPISAEEFLRRYQAVLAKLVPLVPSDIPDEVRDALLRSNFSLPAPMRGVPGAEPIGMELADLGILRPTVKGDSDALNRDIRAAIYAAFPETTPVAPAPVIIPRPPRRKAKKKAEADEETMTFRGGLLGATPPVLRAVEEPVAHLPPSPWFNATLDGHDASAPLEPKKWYEAVFSIDLAPKAGSIGGTQLQSPLTFPEDGIVLTVVLDSDDFDITEPTRPLYVERPGVTTAAARFRIRAKHEGRCTLSASLLKEGNFIQRLDLTLSVGAELAEPPQVATRGRTPAAIGVLQRRDLTLLIEPAEDGFKCVASGAQAMKARLRLSPDLLANAIDGVRQDLMKVVSMTDADGQYVFQDRLEIPDAENAAALRIMAKAGALLFQTVFFSPAAGTDSRQLGMWIRQLGTGAKELRIQVIAEGAMIPWDLLYVGDASDRAVLDWNNFLGMRHVVEQMPFQNTPTVEYVIVSDPDLTISTNYNTDIDQQMGQPFVEKQRSFWSEVEQQCPRMHVDERTTSKQLVDALASEKTGDQICYLYCHAQSVGLDVAWGPQNSLLVLSDAAITLRDLNLNAPNTIWLQGRPLVFINACESAQLSPLFYDGFVPYFMAKGARGVVGTLCRTPALFAADWAKSFFTRFLDGGPLGKTILELREMYGKDHNPLGLLYAVYCDADTQIAPAVR